MPLEKELTTAVREPLAEHHLLASCAALGSTVKVGLAGLRKATLIQVDLRRKQAAMLGALVLCLATANNKIVDLEERVLTNIQAVEVYHHARLLAEASIVGTPPDILIVAERRTRFASGHQLL
ncbi:hypothetical protein HC891_06975 [Candidatus Gracilibacteria bacterium]|nr:hypothetical protein [Candidatus Gracilibacteria bacterium]